MAAKIYTLFHSLGSRLFEQLKKYQKKPRSASEIINLDDEGSIANKPQLSTSKDDRDVIGKFCPQEDL